MIRHIRDFQDDYQSGESPEEDVEEMAQEDRALDVLVKHAMQGTNWLEHDPKRVWQRLSERVRGPFGSMAVEEPANLGTEMPLPQESPATEVYDATSDARRHSLYRLTDVTFPVR
jgi:hypothetical protein